MTRLMRALRCLLDALQDKPESPDMNDATTIFTPQPKSEARTRIMK